MVLVSAPKPAVQGHNQSRQISDQLGHTRASKLSSVKSEQPSQEAEPADQYLLAIPMMALYVPTTPTTTPNTAMATATPWSSFDSWCLQIFSANRHGSTTATDVAMKEPMNDMTDAKNGTAMAVSTTTPSSPVRSVMEATVNFQLLCLISSNSYSINTRHGQAATSRSSAACM